MGLISALAVTAGDLVEKATRAPGGPPTAEVGPRGYQIDPLWVVSALRYKDKPWGLSYDIQRMVAQRDVVVAAVLQVRTHQVGQFARPSRMSQDGRGFVIRARNPKHQLTPVERRWVDAAERFFERTGSTDRPRDRFHALLKKLVRDSLTFDSACHPRGTRVLMADGTSRPIEQIGAGDLVVTHLGRQATVLEVKARPYRGGMVRLVSGGQSVTATAGHPFLVMDEDYHFSQARGTRVPRWLAAGDVRKGMYLVFPRLPADAGEPRLLDVFVEPARRYPNMPWERVAERAGVHPATAAQILCGHYRKQGPAVDRVLGAAEELGFARAPKRIEGEVPLTPEWAFFLGLYAAEGSVNYHAGRPSGVFLTMHRNCRDVLERVAAFFQTFGVASTWYDYEDRQATLLAVNSAAVASFVLREVGVGSHAKRVPVWLLNADATCRRAFLRGYLEGDGHTPANGRGVSFSTVSENLASGLRYLWAQEGAYVRYSVSSAVERGDGYARHDLMTGSVSGSVWRSFATEAGWPVSVPERLVEPYVQDDHYFYLKVGRVETFDTDEDVFNLEVEDDHSYIANGFVSHNCLELVYDRRGVPVEFVCLDGGSIRIVHSPDAQTPDGYVQVIAGRPVVYFEPDEMLYGVRNPRSDLRAASYGLSEVELLIRTITNHLYAEDWSSRLFTSGSAPRGIFWAEGAELTDEMIVALQRAWQSQLSGVLGAHRIGLLKMPQNSRLNYVDLQRSSEDMGYERWLNYLVSAVCSVFLIDPAEVNFPNRAGIGEKPPMVTSGEEHRLTQSADKGLRPLMEFLGAYLTEGILERLPGGDDFVFEFSGVTKRDAKDETAIESQQVRFLKTVNELRQVHDLPEVPDGDVILDPTFISHRASQAAARQMQAPPAGGEDDTAQAWGDEEPEPDGEPVPVEGAVAPEQAALAPSVLTEKPARTPPLAPRAPRSGP